MKKKSKAAINGFSIDEHGKITGTLNLMSYLKVAPRDIKQGPYKPKKAKKMKKNEDGETEEEEDDEEEEDMDRVDEKQAFHDMTDSTNWEIGRTIYSTF